MNKILIAALLCFSWPAHSAWEQVANTARSASHQGERLWVHYPAPDCEPVIRLGGDTAEAAELSYAASDAPKRPRASVADLRRSRQIMIGSLTIDLTGSARAIRAAEQYCRDLAFAKPTQALAKWVTVTGQIEFGWADATIRRIRDANAAGVVLESSGGLTDEAERLGEWIRKNELDTAVLSRCNSACVHAFVGGVDRYVAPDATLGLHRSRAKSGGSHSGSQEDVAAHAEYLQKMGIEQADAIAVRAAATTHLWIDMLDADEALSLDLATAVALPPDAAEQPLPPTDGGPTADDTPPDLLAGFIILAAFLTPMLAVLLLLRTGGGDVQARKQPAHQDRPEPEEQPKNVETASKAAVKIEPAPADRIKSFPKARVQRVIDGDTVIVTTGWHKLKIRLDAIDCPEDGQPWGDTSKHGLIKLIGGRTVHLEKHGQDIHGRTLATIYVEHRHGSDWMNVNERMVTLGHAWVMRRYYDHLPQDRQDRLNRLERWARSKRVGLWRTEKPIPPWQWRSQGRAWATNSGAAP